MPTTINASNTTGGAVVTGDGSGILELQSGGVTGLTVNGANVTVAGTLTATGGIPAITTALTSPLAIVGNSTAGAEIRLPEDTDNGSNYVAIKAPDSLAGNVTFTLPTADGTNGQVLTTNGSGQLSFATPASGSLLRVTVFTSSGTWTKGAGTNYIKVSGVGGGGAGGGVRASVAATGSGGGAGGYFQELINTSGVSTVTVTIGAGGTGVSAAAGNNGGTTSFGAYASGNGGAGGALEGGGGGNGGTATGGDINITGQSGSIGANGVNFPGGLGGSSLLGLGGAMISEDLTGDGKPATGYGGGGGGSATASGGGGTAASTGGAGSSGIVIVEEYA